MKSIKIDQRQVMFSRSYSQLTELRAQLRDLMKRYKALTTPGLAKNHKDYLKIVTKRSNVEDAIVVKRNSIEINMAMHKHYAKEVNQGELIKIDMSEFNYEVFKKYSKENR